LNQQLGTIHAQEAYTVEEFSRRTGLSRAAIRSAGRHGLRTSFVGKRKYIRGAAWLEWLEVREHEQLEQSQRDQREDEADDDDRVPEL
jgi:hypothetical protein